MRFRVAMSQRNDLPNRLPVIDVQPLPSRNFQLPGIESQLLQNGGVDVGDGVAVFDGVEADLVGCSVGDA